LSAVIDKIYGTQSQLVEFRIWLSNNNTQILDEVAPVFDMGRKEMGFDQLPPEHIRNLCNLSEEHEMWLLDNCPIKFIQDRIKEQYRIV